MTDARCQPMPATPRHDPPVCVHCDADLSCGNCGVEQPYTDISVVKAELATASARVVELEAFLRDFADWCNVERHKLGAVDGYDYRSGEEYGLRRTEIEVEKRINARCAALSQTEEGRRQVALDGEGKPVYFEKAKP